MGGRPLAMLDGANHLRSQAVSAAHHIDSNGPLQASRSLLEQVAAQQREQCTHFGIGPAPVVGRECIQAQRADAAPRRRLDDSVDRLGPLAVTGRAGQAALRCPAPIAVHDDCYMHILLLCGTKHTSQKNHMRRVALITASMWSRYRFKAFPPSAVRRQTVLGRRCSKDFVQVKYLASSSLRACALK